MKPPARGCIQKNIRQPLPRGRLAFCTAHYLKYYNQFKAKEKLPLSGESNKVIKERLKSEVKALYSAPQEKKFAVAQLFKSQEELQEERKKQLIKEKFMKRAA